MEVKQTARAVYDSTARFLQKLSISLTLVAIAGLCAYLQYMNNVKGGHSFALSPEDEQMWALSFTALLLLLGLFTAVRAVIPKQKETKKPRMFLLGFIIALATVLGVGGWAGRMSTVENADRSNNADESAAIAMEREAASIRRINESKLPGLEVKANDMGASGGTRNAARGMLDEIQANIERAGQLERQAAAIRKQSSVTSDRIFNGWIALFFLSIQLCIELGFAVCAHYLAVIHGGSIRTIIMNLQGFENYGGELTINDLNHIQEAAGVIGKKPEPLPAESKVRQWEHRLISALGDGPITRKAARKWASQNNIVGIYTIEAERAIHNLQRRGHGGR